MLSVLFIRTSITLPFLILTSLLSPNILPSIDISVGIIVLLITSSTAVTAFVVNWYSLTI